MLLNRTIEILLIDEGSLAICRRCQVADQRIHLLYRKHCGNSQVRNDGLSVVTGDLTTFIDSEDFVDLYYVGNLVQ